MNNNKFYQYEVYGYSINTVMTPNALVSGNKN